MENQKLKYQETQNSYWIIVAMLLAIFFLTLSYLYQWGDNPIDISATIITSSVFVIIILLFFKLKLTIDETKITATFGIGIIKKSIELENIDVHKTKEIRTPWYYGIGIRITQYGVLYNTKPGTAIKIEYKNSEKAFLVGTENFEKIKRILLERA